MNITTNNAATSLTRGLDILRAFTPEYSSLGNQDLIARTQLPAATVSRLTTVLVTMGYLVHDQHTGKYKIGPATISLGYSALSSNPIIHIARPLMQKLADFTGAAIALGVRDSDEMVYIAHCRSMSPVTLQLSVGARVPITQSAMGLAYIAAMDHREREQLLGSMKSTAFLSDSMRTNIDNAVMEYANMGFVSAFGLWYSYINAVGVTFKPTDGSPVFTITCGGISEILSEKYCIETIGPKLVELIQRLHNNLQSTHSL